MTASIQDPTILFKKHEQNTHLPFLHQNKLNVVEVPIDPTFAFEQTQSMKARGVTPAVAEENLRVGYFLSVIAKAEEEKFRFDIREKNKIVNPKPKIEMPVLPVHQSIPVKPLSKKKPQTAPTRMERAKTAPAEIESSLDSSGVRARSIAAELEMKIDEIRKDPYRRREILDAISVLILVYC